MHGHSDVRFCWLANTNQRCADIWCHLEDNDQTVLFLAIQFSMIPLFAHALNTTDI